MLLTQIQIRLAPLCMQLLNAILSVYILLIQIFKHQFSSNFLIHLYHIWLTRQMKLVGTSFDLHLSISVPLEGNWKISQFCISPTTYSPPPPTYCPLDAHKFSGAATSGNQSCGSFCDDIYVYT